MNVLRIGFLGTRTTSFQQTADFFQNTLGLQTAWEKPDWTGFRLPTGKNDFVEVFGPAKQDPNLYPDSATGIIIAFIVDDVVSAYAEVPETGIELLSEVIWVPMDMVGSFCEHQMVMYIVLSKFQKNQELKD